MRRSRLVDNWADLRLGFSLPVIYCLQIVSTVFRLIVDHRRTGRSLLLIPRARVASANQANIVEYRWDRHAPFCTQEHDAKLAPLHPHCTSKRPQIGASQNSVA